MKITKKQLKRIIREQMTPADLGIAAAIEDNIAASRTESGDPQSYAEFATRLKQVEDLLEGIAEDYVDSGWLEDGDHASLGRSVDELVLDAGRLRGAAEGLAESMGEM
tara:strand:- start:10830 stop:11153 length:324 start_codon:yes stop_codon:yes gene_type:complete